ncbi:MAG: CocE/NonD family hydrolase, partial [Actinomycetota bacterium]
MSRLRGSRLLVVVALVCGLVVVRPSTGSAAPAPWTHFEMADGTKIAAAVRYPKGFRAGSGRRLPVLFSMDGYAAGGSEGIDPASFGNRYITVYASIRGTGCSGGAFNLFDRRHSEDGYEIVANHLPRLAGSTGDVGIIGHSYPGLTGWLTASTNPPNLKAIAISGLIDDLYRGIVYPGGVPNYGFPLIWTGAYRPGVEVAGNAGRYIDETANGDATCASNLAMRPTHAHETLNSVLENPIVHGGTSLEDGSWWRLRSTVTWINGIRKPIHITQQFQDEQTGPRGGHVLFQRLGERVPKRLVLTNGVHSTTSVAHNDRLAWLDCYILEERSQCARVADRDRRVNLLVDTTSGNAVPAGEFDYTTSDWPAPETRWTRYYLHADGSLGTSAIPGEAPRSFVYTPTGRHITADAGGLSPTGLDEVVGTATFGDGPDVLRYELPFKQDTAIAGPINLTLTASSTAVNTDFFVDVLDVAPNGDVHYLQRGMQRASHHEIDRHPSRTDYTKAGDVYRAWHPHTNTVTKLLTPTVPKQFEVEVFPIGHVFRRGHKLRLQIHSPPALDPLSVYAWVSNLPPAVNTVY